MKKKIFNVTKWPKFEYVGTIERISGNEKVYKCKECEKNMLGRVYKDHNCIQNPMGKTGPKKLRVSNVIMCLVCRF